MSQPLTSQTRRNYYALEEVPRLQEICQNWEVVRDEYLNLNAPVMDINRIDKAHGDVVMEVFKHVAGGGEYGWVQGWGQDGGNPDWLQFGLMSNNPQANAFLGPHVSTKVPKTFDMLQKIGGIKIAAFVTLKPMTILHCHTHPEIHDEKLLQLHVALQTAETRNYAYLNVAGEFRQHVPGEPIIFDGSLDHFALNESDHDRTILYMEFARDV